ncbi:OmpA family protein [Litorisediminicola beolgyonensis]|uniref:OmpA family protein n=1 Tax=Litorisediminicola beolgyonensis TaxID=1173614 RepID=A0ABW3ZJ86_9RHOB
MTPITPRLASLAALLFVASPGQALELALPRGATLTAEETSAGGRYALPTGPWTAETGLPVRPVEGPMTRRAWRLPATGATVQQLFAPLRDAILEAGFEPLLDCTARQCGGFDFRFATEVLPAPEMYVDLTDYRFLSATGPDGAALSLLVSRSATAGHVQVIEVGEAIAETTQTTAPDIPLPAVIPNDIGAALERDGHVVLTDMRFESGDATLGDAPVASLDALAEYLAANPSRVVLFVGHTDAVGSLDANQALSRRRATAAIDYLRARHATDPGQISAAGAGYLSPVASNLTPEGRVANRRVEAVLLSTE